MLGGVDEPDGRAIQVGASHRVSTFDVAQRDVAGMTQESSDAPSARSVLPLAARVIMVHVDELPLLKRLMAHTAGLQLRSQQAVELLLGQPVARDPVLPVGLLARLRRLAMRVVAVVQPVALHGFGRLTRASMPGSTGTCRLLSRHPHAAPLLPHSGKVYLRLLGFALRHAESLIRNCGRSRI
jgi:hypothetical protein